MPADNFRLDTTGRNGSDYTFEAEVEADPTEGTWIYRVFATSGTDFYEARFKRTSGGYIQPDMLDRHHETFRGKGIAEALFYRVVKDAKMSLRSSANTGATNFGSEYRTEDATRVWRRLLAQDRASYEAAEDRFTFRPEGSPPPPGSFRRIDLKARPTWYVKGSFVLDRIFGTDHAKDIDVCWVGVSGKPPDQLVREWCTICGFPAKSVQTVKVNDFFACDGGGGPIFNVDTWRLDMDGCVYDVDPLTKEAIRLPAPPAATLDFLPNLAPLALIPSIELNAFLEKAIRKMQLHPTLYSAATEEEIKKLMARPLPGR